MVFWGHDGPRSLPHRSRRGAECLTDEGEKRLVVERLQEKGKRAAFQRSGRESRVFPCRSSRSLSCRATPRAAALALPGRSSRASTHRARPGAPHGCGRTRKTSESSKLCSFSPSESSSCLIECRTDASSSRMHMDSGSGDMGSAPDTNPSAGPSVRYFAG
jgi:hypothetical protein